MPGPRRIARARPTFASGPATLTFALPAAAQKGDLLLVITAAGSEPITSFPAGWTELTFFIGSNSRLRLYGKSVAENEPTSIVWDFGAAASDHQGQLLVYRPAAPGIVLEASAGADHASSTSHAAPSVACVQPNNVELCVWRAHAAVTYTAPVGMTVVDQYSSSVVGARSLLVAELEPAAAVGALPARTATLSGAAVGSSFSLVLRDRPPLRSPYLDDPVPGNIGLMP